MRSLILFFGLAASLGAQGERLSARDLFFERDGDAKPTRLGVSYQLLRVDVETGKGESVDAETNLEAGTCLAVAVEANRAAQVYVFNWGSSGAWQILLPSSRLTGESNRIESNATVRVPAEHCFQIEGPKGVDSLLLVVTERAEDVEKLNVAMRDTGEPAEDEPRLMRALDNRRPGQILPRDLAVQKVGSKVGAKEKSNLTYVVNTSARAKDRVTVEIRIRHE
jgi:hypothetical protein